MTIWLWIIGITAVVWPIVCGFWFYADLQARLLNVAQVVDAQNYAAQRKLNDLEERIAGPEEDSDWA
jgi:hypothetical protein